MTTPDPTDLRLPAETMLAESAPTQDALPPEAEAAAPDTRRSSGQFEDIWRRFRRNRLAVAGLAVVCLMVIVAFIAPFITPYSLGQDMQHTIQPPDSEHLLGTDVLGRDFLTLMLYGLRLALLVGLGTMVGSMFIGILMGAIAGYLGGAWDSLLMRITDIFLAFPYLVGAIVIVRAVDPVRQKGAWPVIIALIVLGWMTSARLMRGQVLALREAEYVEAARSIGASSTRIVIRHIMPNAIAPVLIYSFTSIGVAIVAMASLSFLGVGVGIDVPEWGQMISEGFQNFGVPNTSYLWVYPSIAIIVTVLAFAFVADGLRDSLDPKLR